MVLCYTLPSEPTFGCFVCLSSEENAELVLWGWPNTVWFHLFGIPSAHVHVRLPPHIEIGHLKAETVEECGQLCKAYSAHSSQNQAVQVVYTPLSNVMRIAEDEPVGVAFFDSEKCRQHTVFTLNAPLLRALERTREERRKPEKAEDTFKPQKKIFYLPRTQLKGHEYRYQQLVEQLEENEQTERRVVIVEALQLVQRRILAPFLRGVLIFLDELLATLQLEENEQRDAIVTEYSKFAKNFLRFFEIKNCEKLTRLCVEEHATKCCTLWLLQGTARNEMYLRMLIGIEQYESLCRVKNEFEEGGLCGRTVRSSSIGTTASASVLTQRRDDASRYSPLKDPLLLMIRDAVLEHRASRARLEWEEELAGEELRSSIHCQLRNLRALFNADSSPSFRRTLQRLSS